MIDPLLATLADADVAALTLWGEARGEPIEGQIAIGCVIRTRSGRAGFGGPTYAGVCLQPEQFSCWNAGDPNRAVLLGAARDLTAGRDVGPIYRQCRWIVDGLLADAVLDRVRGAQYYLTRTLFVSHPPVWATGHDPVASIGAHVFLRL